MTKRYEALATVLLDALDQAQTGKGHERHAQGETPFDRQPICEIARMVGTGYCTGQAMKKAQEAMRLPNDRAQAEMLGAINYLAAAVIVLREQAGEGVKDALREMADIAEDLDADTQPGSPKRRHMADKGEPMPRQSPHMGFPDLSPDDAQVRAWPGNPDTEQEG